MQFYCPVCQAIVETAPETTVVTKLNQTAYKAHCPTCKQDLAVYGKQESVTVSPVSQNTDITAVV